MICSAETANSYAATTLLVLAPLSEGALAAAGAGLRTATVEDVLQAVEAMRVKEDGSPVKPTTVNTYVASVKSFLGFAHCVGFTRFSAGPLIKLKKVGDPGAR